MKISRFKRLASYLTELHVETTGSEYNPVLIVSLSRGRLQLSTHNAIYSFADLYDNYRIAFQRLKWDTWTGEELLILGLGLASIPYMLEKKFGKKFNITAVEIDEEVIRLAQKYVLGDLDAHVNTFTGDAGAFVEIDDKRYDMICLDVFKDDFIPDALKTYDFLMDLQERMANDGILMYNVLSRTQEDLKTAREFYENTFKKAFPNADYIPSRGNWILVNDGKWFRT